MRKLPLEGIRIIDFCQMWAGPHVTQWLAVMGAEVIKIETSLRLDQQRQRKPPDGSGGFACLNYGKKSITLNMTQPKAVELVKKLVSLSDIVADNFGGAIMERWGLGYSELKKVKADIIVYSGSGYGRTGPHRERPAYAEIVSAFDGLTSVNGYPGSEPATIGVNAWTDGTQATHGVFAFLAALYYRSKTGNGQYIDAAMVEASANFLSEMVMGYTINGAEGSCVGNRDNVMAPHGCYRCKGEDKWVAIAVSNEEEWQAFCQVIGNPEWTRKEEFSDELSRWHNQTELDRYVEEWTKNYDHYEVMDRLQKAGVMAGASLSVEELFNDPNLKEREFFINTEHPVIGNLPFAGLPWRLSNSPRGNYVHAPLLGEHNEYVFGGLLGLSKDEISKLIEEKVIY